MMLWTKNDLCYRKKEGQQKILKDVKRLLMTQAFFFFFFAKFEMTNFFIQNMFISKILHFKKIGVTIRNLKSYFLKNIIFKIMIPNHIFKTPN